MTACVHTGVKSKTTYRLVLALGLVRPVACIAQQIFILTIIHLQILFVINNPEVYKSPNSNTYM